jgi:WD40 repeat protein
MKLTLLVALVSVLIQSELINAIAQSKFQYKKLSLNSNFKARQSQQQTVSSLAIQDEPYFKIFTADSPVLSLLALGDGNLAVGCFDGTIKIVNIASASLVQSIRAHAGPVWSLSYSAVFGHAVSASADKTVKVWNLDDFTLNRTLTDHTDEVNVVMNVYVELATASDDFTIKIWNLDYNLETTLTGHSSYVTVMQLIAWKYQTFMLSGSYDKTIIMWNTYNWSYMSTLVGHTSSVLALNAVSGFGGYTFASADANGTINIWQYYFTSATIKKTVSGHEDSVTSLQPLYSSNRFATGSKDKTIKIWNPVDSSLNATLRAHSDNVLSLTLTRSSYLISAGADGLVVFWNIK